MIEAHGVNNITAGEKTSLWYRGCKALPVGKAPRLAERFSECCKKCGACRPKPLFLKIPFNLH